MSNLINTRLILALIALSATGDLAVAQEVGRASAVNPAAITNARTIVIGESITSRQRIQTQASGSVQLLFIDKTSMTIGPNSDLTIDEYVYDPKASTGKLAATLGKGAMRFVGGQVSHNGDAEIKTASAVIGIRGGLALISATSVYTGYGQATVSSGGANVTLGVGEFTQTPGQGNPPTPPAPPPAGFVAAQIQAFQSSGGQTGGAPAGSASPARVAAAEARVTGSPTATVAAVAPVVNGAVQVAATTTAASNTTTTTQQNTVINTVQQAAQTSTQSTATIQTATEIVQRRQFSAMPYALTVSNCCTTTNPASTVPYLPAGFAVGSNSYVSPLLGYRTASLDTANRAPYFQFGIGITGNGASQTSWFMVATGALLDDGNGGFVFSSGFGATRRGAANLSVGRASGAISSVAGSVALDSFSLPTSANITDAYYIPESKTYVSQQAAFFLGNGVAVANYDFAQTANRIATPSGLGDNRPSVVLTGWAGGLMRTFNQTTNQFPAPSFAVGGPATINLDPNLNRMQANFFVANLTKSANDTFTSASYQIGTVDPALRSRGVYVDYDNFGAREAVTVSNTTTGATTPVSTVNGQALTGQVAILANAPRAIAQQLAIGNGGTGGFCQCDYTRWGFWSNDNYRTDANGNAVADRGNLLTWVAGRHTTIAEVPTTGSATYDGHVIASIKSGANEYVAAGALTNTVNFGTRTGSVTVTGLDNTNYTGTVSISQSDPRSFVAGLSSGTSGRSLALNGQFFRGVSSPVGEMGGGAFISGSNYIGSGIFAAKMR